MDFPGGEISYTTIANNTTGGQGGGIYSIRPSVNLQTTIVGNNAATTGGPDCYDQGGLGGAGYNLISNLSPAAGSGSCLSAFSGGGDLVDVDPLLGALQDNGGPTHTHALTTLSPARSQIPNATNDCGNVTTDDQRTAPRPGTSLPVDMCDIGAWEAQEGDDVVPAKATAVPTMSIYHLLLLMLGLGFVAFRRYS